MQSSLKCFRVILLVFWLESVTVFSANFDPTSFYQRSNDGSYRYGYSAGGGFNARQSATSANEVVGQYAQLQPDGRIANVRYKAGVGGFQPQYGAASSAYNGAAFGAPGSLRGQGGGLYRGGSLSAGPFGSRSVAGVSAFGPGSFNTPRPSFDGSLYGGSVGAYSPGGGYYGSTAAGSRPLAGGSPFGSGPFNTPRSSIDGGSTDGGFNSGASLGPGSPASRSPLGGSLGTGYSDGRGLTGSGQLTPGSSVNGGSREGGFNDGASLGPGSPASRSPLGGSFGTGYIDGRGSTASGQLTPGSTGSRSPYGSDAFGNPYLGAGLAGPSYGGFQYPGPRYAVTPAYSVDSNLRRRPPFGIAPTPQPFLISSTPTPISNTGPLGDGSYRFSYANDNSARTESGDPSGTVRGPNTGFQPTGGSLAAPNGLPNAVTSTTTTAVPVAVSQSGPRNDGTYNFAYRTPDSTRQESADNRGNVHGPSTGFQPTGGSLAVPNGLGLGRPSMTTSTISPIGTTFATTTIQNGAGGRSGLEFEPTDSGIVYTNNDQGQLFTTTVRPMSFQNRNSAPNYSQQNDGFGGQGSYGAGGADQRYGGSASNGFRPAGGSLANTNRLSGDTSSQAGLDGSHGNSFTDSQLNSRGASATLSNNDLSFDRGNGLSYGAGASRGLSGRGGSFANSYGISGGGGQNYGSRPAGSKGGSDGSYNFSYDTGRQAHQESSDGRGKVDGRYSYLSDGGQRSLSYRIRPGTGFEVTGGNLASKTPK